MRARCINSIYSRNSFMHYRHPRQFAKKIFLICTLLLPASPLWAELAQPTSTAVRPKRKKVKDMTFLEKSLVCAKGIGRLAHPKRYKNRIDQMINAAKKVTFFETPSGELARAAYGTGPYQLDAAKSILGKNEQDELLLNDLVHALSTHMKTAIGPWALSNMLMRTNQEDTLHIQHEIRRLVEDDALYGRVEKVLNQFARHQDTIYNYWDDNITVTKNGKTHFFAQVDNLQRIVLFQWMNVVFPSFIASPISNAGNQFLENFHSPKVLGANAWLCLVLNTPLLWVQAGAKGIVDGVKKHLIIGKKLDVPKAWHEGIDSFNNTFGLFWNSEVYGDFETAIKNYQDAKNKHALHPDAVTKVNLKSAKAYLGKVTYDLASHGTPKDLWKASEAEGPRAKANLGGIGKNMQSMLSYLPGFIHRWFSLGSFDKEGTFTWGSDQSSSSHGLDIGRLWRAAAIGYEFATTRFIVVASQLMHSICGSLRNYEAWKLLDRYVKRVERGFKAMQQAHTILGEDGCLSQSYTYSLLHKSLAKPKGRLRDLIRIADTPITKQQRIKQYGGRSLIEHNLIQQVIPQVRPALWGMAHLDAMYALATLLRNQDAQHPMCFVQFLPDEQEAHIEIQDGVLPMVEHSIPNDVTLGGVHPNKMVVAGPNGAGKSIYLKMMGCNAIMAHMLGIAAARSMKCSWFNAIRTCINPSEKVNQLSKLQAEKMRLDGILDEFGYLVKEDPTYKELFITDEPLSGTTNKIAGRFIYEYGRKIEQWKGLAVCMATHNEKPTELALGGYYGNYQVGMQLNDTGLPEATFKVLPGIPHWWFSTDQKDIETQDTFVRYTVSQKYKEDLAGRKGELEKVMKFCESKLEAHEYRTAEEKNFYKLQIKMVERELERVQQELAKTDRLLRSWKGDNSFDEALNLP
jgi:hypothetical protein